MVTEPQMARVVAELAAGASDPRHVQATVGAFMREQPIVGHYVASHSSELGSEGVVLTLLHAAVVKRGVEISIGRALRATNARELDAAARLGHSEASLRTDEPAISDYLTANIASDDPTLGGRRRAIALELLHVIVRAFVRQG